MCLRHAQAVSDVRVSRVGKELAAPLAKERKKRQKAAEALSLKRKEKFDRAQKSSGKRARNR